MKTVFAVLLSCVSVFGAESDIQIVSTSKTNAETASVSTKDVFTRSGQTILVRNTKTKAGTVQIRIHRFYQDGSLVGMMTETPDSSSTTSEGGSPFALGFEYGPSNRLKYAVISKDGILVDAFTCTNGVFSPVSTTEISRAASAGEEAKKLMSPDRKISPDQFGHEVNSIVEKHK